MSEGYITLLPLIPEGTKPFYRGFIKIDGVDHEFALWPAKDGKKGFVGKYKPKEDRPSSPQKREVSPETQKDLDKLYGEEIPF